MWIVRRVLLQRVASCQQWKQVQWRIGPKTVSLSPSLDVFFQIPTSHLNICGSPALAPDNALLTSSLGILSGLFFINFVKAESGWQCSMKMKSIENPRLNWKEKILVSIQVRQKCSWNEKRLKLSTLGSCPCFREFGIYVGSAKLTLFTSWRIPNAPDVFRTSWTCWTCSMARCWHIFEFCRRVWRHPSKTEDLMGAVGNFQWYAGCLLDRTTALLFLVIDIHRPKGRSYPIEHEQHLHQYAPGDPVGSSWYHKSHPSPRSCWWVFADCACSPEKILLQTFSTFHEQHFTKPIQNHTVSGR